ncbi:hypothetical protein MASR1M59_00250 [Melaminivora sp.]
MTIFSRRQILSHSGTLALAALLPAWPAAAAEAVAVADVSFPSAQTLQGKSLQLNGAGVRYKAVFKVYAAGLYLEKKAATPAEVQAQKGPKRLSVTMLRDIDSSELGKLFSRGMEDNLDRAVFSKLIPGVLRMSQIFSEHKMLKSGDNFSVDWLPGTGTLVTVKGQPQGEPFKEPEFFDALLSIWLGQQPADWKLKDALLGKG